MNLGEHAAISRRPITQVGWASLPPVLAVCVLPGPQPGNAGQPRDLAAGPSSRAIAVKPNGVIGDERSES